MLPAHPLPVSQPWFQPCCIFSQLQLHLGSSNWCPFIGLEVASHCRYSLSVSISLFGSLNCTPNHTIESFTTEVVSNESSKRNDVSCRTLTDNWYKGGTTGPLYQLLLNQVWFLELNKSVLILYTSLKIFTKKFNCRLYKWYIC